MDLGYPVVVSVVRTGRREDCPPGMLGLLLDYCLMTAMMKIHVAESES
jgi:hypothetical protein